MLATSDDPHAFDLFGPVPAAQPADEPIAQSDAAPSRAPRAKRALKSTATAASVDPRVAMAFSLRELFPELTAMQASVAPRPVPTGAGNAFADAPALSVLTIPDDEDSPSFEMGPRSTVTDQQLREEQLAWEATELTDAWAANFMWRLQVAHLEENLAFLFSVDIKPRVTMEKGHILQWIFTEDVVGPLDFRENHLSFHRCCKAYGINDPDEFREMLLNCTLIRELLVSLHLYHEWELPKQRPVVMYADIVGTERALADNQVYQFPGM